MEFIRSDIFMIVMTFGVYFGALELQRRFKTPVLNPVLLTIAFIIAFLKFTGLEYHEYAGPGRLIEFWLKPAIVALAVPLYANFNVIRRQFVPIFVSQMVGCVVGIVSVVLIAKWMGGTTDVLVSLAPKSVTTPIAVEIATKLGGIPSLTAAIVIVVGLIGSVAGMKMMQWGRIRSSVSIGLSMGTAAHVLGTNRVSEIGERYGAFATVGLILNGVLTALVAPMLLPWLL